MNETDIVIVFLLIVVIAIAVVGLAPSIGEVIDWLFAPTHRYSQPPQSARPVEGQPIVTVYAVSESEPDENWYRQEARRFAARTEYEVARAEHEMTKRFLEDERRR